MISFGDNLFGHDLFKVYRYFNENKNDTQAESVAHHLKIDNPTPGLHLNTCHLVPPPNDFSWIAVHRHTPKAILLGVFAYF